MNLTIKKFDSNNSKEILELRVNSNQESYIETVGECIEEASKCSNWRPVGIYDGEKIVGFAMYALFLEEGENGRVWLDRLLISAENQGKGYGEAAVRVLLKRLYKEYGYDKIYLSVYDDNEVAIALYEKIGFQFTGEVDTKGEKLMAINLQHEERKNE